MVQTFEYHRQKTFAKCERASSLEDFESFLQLRNLQPASEGDTIYKKTSQNATIRNDCAKNIVHLCEDSTEFAKHKICLNFKCMT